MACALSLGTDCGDSLGRAVRVGSVGGYEFRLCHSPHVMHVLGFRHAAVREHSRISLCACYFQHSSRVLVAPATPFTPVEVSVNLPQASVAALVPVMGAMVRV